MTVNLTGPALQAVLDDPNGLLLTGEVAALLRVDSKTVTRWCNEDPPRLASVRTPGRHRRISAPQIRAIMTGERQL